VAVKVVFRLGDFLLGEAEAAADLACGEAGKAVLVKEGADPIESYRANEGTDRGGDDGSGTDRLADRVRKPVKVRISSEGIGGKIFSAAINKATAT
jgi:hypothetical protein